MRVYQLLLAQPENVIFSRLPILKLVMITSTLRYVKIRCLGVIILVYDSNNSLIFPVQVRLHLPLSQSLASPSISTSTGIEVSYPTSNNWYSRDSSRNVENQAFKTTPVGNGTRRQKTNSLNYRRSKPYGRDSRPSDPLQKLKEIAGHDNEQLLEKTIAPAAFSPTTPRYQEEGMLRG